MAIERAEGLAARLLSHLFWEFAQNLPLVAGFVLGLELWRQGRVGLALACLGLASLAGSLLIRATESRMVAGHREPLRLVVANVLVIAALMAVLVAYLAAPWSHWWTDVIAGLAGGLLLGMAQDLAASTWASPGHWAAFSLSLAMALPGVRLLSTSLPLLANVAIVTAGVTIAIVLLDYRPWRRELAGEEDASGKP